MNIDPKQIVALSEQGLSKKKIAVQLQCSKSSVERCLKRAGIKLVNYHNAVKFDNTVFDCIDTEEKAYWLGFLYADGSVASENSNNIELSLSAKDVNHLEKYRRFLKAPNSVKISDVTVKGKVYGRCRLTVSNKHLKQQLIQLGCY